MKKILESQKVSRLFTTIFIFLIFQLSMVTNSYAIKLVLNGQPDLISPALNLTESVVYNYSDPFRPIVTNTDSPYLCIGPNLAGTPSANVSFGLSSSDPFRIYGLVGINSVSFDYSPPLLIDKVVNIQTNANSQCVVNGYSKVSNPSPGNPYIFLDSFESGGGSSALAFPDLNITLLEETLDNELSNNEILSNANDFVYRYKLENIGDQPLNLDFADYFSIPNNSTIWSCVVSIGADALTTCGNDNNNPQFNSGTTDPYNGGVYLRDAHIENVGEFIVVTVTRNPIITVDGTPVDILASALVTGAVDAYKVNNSDTRTFVGNTNMPPTISTVATQAILEDAAGTGILNFTVADIETPAANLVVTATSSDQSVVSDANITIGSGLTDNDRTVSVVANANANTASGAVTITLEVTDSSAGTNTSIFTLDVTPVNDKPSFSVVAIPDYPAGSSGSKIVPNFIQNVVFGPTSDESSQSISSRSISIVSDTNGVLNSNPLLATDLFLDLSGIGGTVMLNVQIQDDGNTANSGLDTSDFVAFSFTVLNTLPSISTVNNSSVNEDGTTSSIAFTVSDTETAAGSLTMSASSSDPSIIPVSGILFGGSGGSRTVQITPATNQNTAINATPVTITLIVNDGSDTSQTTFDLTVNPINDAPSFSLASNILWPAAESGIKQHANYASTMVMGPTSDEVNTQAPLQFNITLSGDAIFSSNPTIDTSGSLAYVLDGTSGVATVQVSLQDDGAIANGGVDTSATQTFTITVQ